MEHIGGGAWREEVRSLGCGVEGDTGTLVPPHTHTPAPFPGHHEESNLLHALSLTS